MGKINYNVGKLVVMPEQNIIYHRRGLDEISINITNNCPNSCVFCIRDHDPGWGVSNLYLKQDPTVSEIIGAVVNEFQKLRSQNVSLPIKIKICGYGEPILCIHELPQIVQMVNDLYPGLIWQLTTTGWPIFYIHKESYEEEMLNLHKVGVQKIYLSLHALDAIAYQKLVRPLVYEDKAFDLAVKFARLARSISFEVTLAFIKRFFFNKSARWRKFIETESA